MQGLTLPNDCTRVVCECHGYKRVWEPGRVPVNMLKRLSQKALSEMSYSSKTTELCMEPST